MTTPKWLAVFGAILILGLTAAAEANQTPRSETRNPLREANGQQARPWFVDENGDGICDMFRDHDHDGIPNHQDPDWDRPQDGNGFKNGQEQRRSRLEFGDRQWFRKGMSGQFSTRSFRNGRGGGLAGGGCDGTGPKGSGTGRGGR